MFYIQNFPTNIFIIKNSQVVEAIAFEYLQDKGILPSLSTNVGKVTGKFYKTREQANRVLQGMANVDAVRVSTKAKIRGITFTNEEISYLRKVHPDFAKVFLL